LATTGSAGGKQIRVTLSVGTTVSISTTFSVAVFLADLI
jgi:hypothetical protein